MSRRRIVLSPRAELDLDEVWLHIAEDDVSAADRFIDRIHSTLQRLALFPAAGRARGELAPGLRSFPVGDYVVFYRAAARRGIEVIRVLHGSRDVEPLLP